MLKKFRLSGALLVTISAVVIAVVISSVMMLGRDADVGVDDTAPTYGDSAPLDLLYEIWVDGEMLCVTDNLSDYFHASGSVEKLMSEKLGYAHSISDDLSIELIAIRTSAKPDSVDRIYETLAAKTESNYDDCYALYLGGNVVGYCPLSEKENLETIVADIIGYVSENHSNHNETSVVYAAPGYTRTDKIVSNIGDVLSAINAGGSNTQDDLDESAADIITSIDNAILFGNSSSIPEDVTPTVTIVSERVRRTETEPVAFDRLRAPDTDFGLRYGDDEPDFVYIKGKNGQCTVEYEDVYVDGVYSHTVRIEDSLVVTVDPIDEVTVYGTQSTVASFDFIWPTVGWVTSEYGPRKAEISGMSTYHKGIDIARTGNPNIVATDAGEVIHVAYSSSYGWNVVLYHGEGIATRYAHMCRRPEVEVGDRVFKGEHIGNMGKTGNVTGAHLHFEVYKNFVSMGNMGDRINPRKYLPSGSPAVQW